MEKDEKHSVRMKISRMERIMHRKEMAVAGLKAMMKER